MKSTIIKNIFGLIGNLKKKVENFGVFDLTKRMEPEFEPPPKKLKAMESGGVRTISNYIDESIDQIKTSTANLIPIMSDHFTTSITLTKVHTALIKNPKDISKIILGLNEKYPLKELQHLKRVHKKEVVITLIGTVAAERIEAFVKEGLAEFADILEDYKVRDVPARPPKLKWQLEECNKNWPCNFHPNKYNERLFSGAFFDVKELAEHRMYMEIVFEVLRVKLTNKLSDTFDNPSEYGVTIVVDPNMKSIVAIGFDNRNEHPLQHSAMLAIDNVARTQNGGAWGAIANESREMLSLGTERELCSLLMEKFPNLKFGAKPFRSRRTDEDQSGPYLCTGYDVYLLNEPCVMCAMALVHARAKRLFFCHENAIDGALKSKAKLQTIASLNHHFEVFTGFS